MSTQATKKAFSRVGLVLAQCSATLGGEGGTCYVRTSLVSTLQNKHIYFKGKTLYIPEY